MVKEDRVLITGASGLLGRYLLISHPKRWDVFGLYHKNRIPGGCSVDIRNCVNVQCVIDNFRPTIVIHCAGIGSVDYCQSHQEVAREVNIVGLLNVMRACESVQAKLVYMSSNAVFDGKNAPYAEDAARRPVNVYGEMKAIAEDIVIHSYPYDSLIVRPIMLYGTPNEGGRGNWATRTFDFLCDSKRMKVVCDTLTQPTYALDCAQTIWALIEYGKSGVYNVAGSDKMSLHNFVMKIAEVFDLPHKLVDAVSSTYFKHLAPRPVDTTYTTRKLCEAGVNFTPGGVMQGLARMKHE